MPYHVIQDFRLGMDISRPAYMSPSGTVYNLINGHVMRGGDIENRKAFVAKYALPANTFGLAAVGGALYVFGSVAAPAMPAGVTYMQLTNGAKVMADVLFAEAFNGQLYVVVLWTDTTISHFYNGVLVSAWFDGRARATFDVNGGAVATDTFTSVKVNGVEILGAAVAWSTSHSVTASLIAAQINAFASTPEYTASTAGPTVYLEATAAAGAGPNGFPVAVTVTGEANVTTPTYMQGGVAPGATYTPGRTVRTFKSKLYSTSGSNLHACAIDTPTDWNTTTNGAWFVNLSNYASGAQALVATAKYYDQLAVFSDDTTLVWHVESDPLNNKQTQEVPDIGALGGHATATYRDGGVYFFSDQGVKALKARDASNFALVADESLPIDRLMRDTMNASTPAEKAATIVTIEPESGRLWAILGDTIFVLSSFPRNNIHAWSLYAPGFSISATAVNNRRMYVRSGDTIYLYGGDDNATYDTSELEVLLPYVTLQAPATFKRFHAVDVGCAGTWSIYMRPDPDSDVEELIAENYTGVSYDQPTIAVGERTTHCGLRLTHELAEQCTLSSVALHYQLDEARG
jgi:hypothetical protein